MTETTGSEWLDRTLELAEAANKAGMSWEEIAKGAQVNKFWLDKVRYGTLSPGLQLTQRLHDWLLAQAQAGRFVDPAGLSKNAS